MTKRKKAWLKRRQKGVGGSDISALMNVNPFRNAIDVYKSKFGEVEDESNPAMETGTVLENYVAERYADEFLEYVRKPKKENYTGTKPYYLGSVDRLLDRGEVKAILEIKTTKFRELKQYYIYQAQWYAGILNLDTIVIAVLRLPRNFDRAEFIKRHKTEKNKRWYYELLDKYPLEVYEYKTDYKLIKQMQTVADYFWTEYVMQKVEPPKKLDLQTILKGD